MSADGDGAVRNGYSRPPSQPNTPNIETDGMGAFSFPPQRKPAHPPIVGQTVRPKSNRSQSFSKSFKFPPEPAPAATSVPKNLSTRHSQSSSGHERLGLGLQTDVPGLANGVARIDLQSEHGEPASPATTHQDFNSDTPRSSIEFYSLSNGTNETLLSEYDQRMPPYRMGRSPHNRRHSLLSISGRPTTESLMMGYAQVMGSFVVDGSLMQTALFEEVKRKGIVSTHGGGGVVGLESSKTDGGFLGGFSGWGLSSLLGGNNLSTIAEMKHTASMVGL